MNRGILFAAFIAFVGSGATTSCRRPADPKQLSTLDSLRTRVEAVALTLEELDVTHYAVADSILNANQQLFMERFADTLDRPTATLLGDQFVQLREAVRMADDHSNVRTDAEDMTVRLIALRNDITSGAIDHDTGERALEVERSTASALTPRVDRVISNYQHMQRVLERQAAVDSLLLVKAVNPELQ